MKTVLFFFFCLLLGLVSSAQTVVSSCTASDSVKALYLRDADRLTLRKIYAQNLSYTSAIVIPQNHTDTVLRALLAVYNATSLPARNMVVSQFNIHSKRNPDVHLLDVAADSTLPWMQQLRLGNLITGNVQVDALLSQYVLTVQYYSNFSGLMPVHLVRLTTDSSYNLLPLANLFSALTGVQSANPTGLIGDGADITAKIYPAYVELDYSIAWGDCPAGCIYRHHWRFQVNYNCHVSFTGEYGSPLPVVAAPGFSVTGRKCVGDTVTVSVSGATSISMNQQTLSASMFTLSPSMATTYTIFATNFVYPALPATSTFSITFVNCQQNTTGLSNAFEISNYAIFPNPADSELSIKNLSPDSNGEIMAIRLYNHLGIMLKEIQACNRMNTADFGAGLYYMEVLTTAGFLKRYPVILMHQ